MQNEATETNELDNPTELNTVPKTTAEILDPLKGFDAEAQRQKEYVKKELVKLEHQAWEHEDTADYTEATAIPPVQQVIEKNHIAIVRHREIIEEIEKSGSKTREDRDRKKASAEDIKILEKEQVSRAQFKTQLEKLIESRRNSAVEVRLHMQFLAKKYEHLFKE